MAGDAEDPVAHKKEEDVASGADDGTTGANDGTTGAGENDTASSSVFADAGSIKVENSGEDLDGEAAAAAESMAAAVQDVAMEVVGEATAGRDSPVGNGMTPKKKRLCRYPGCTRVIKSQGHCQRHGAKAKRCKIDGCEKQAQGTHDGMCKRHWKAIHFPDVPTKTQAQPPPPEGESVYDSVLPKSISYRPSVVAKPSRAMGDKADPMDPPPAPDGVGVMPLVTFLREGANRAIGWHRNAERRARGFFPVSSLSSQLEPWERQLALVEILLLSGGTPYANFKDLSHAWGREKGFHHVLANSVCERRGEVERKRRSDAGRILSPEQKEAFRKKLKRNKVNPQSKGGNPNSIILNGHSNHDTEGEPSEDGDQEMDHKDDVSADPPMCMPVGTASDATGVTNSSMVDEQDSPAETSEMETTVVNL